VGTALRHPGERRKRSQARLGVRVRVRLNGVGWVEQVFAAKLGLKCVLLNSRPKLAEFLRSVADVSRGSCC
jgi:hypothetical protein